MDKNLTMTEMLKYVVSKKASDLHLGDGMCPAIRLDSELVMLSETPLAKGDTMKMLREHLSEERIEEFEKTLELDYSFGISGLGRFRVNVYRQRSNIACAVR